MAFQRLPESVQTLYAELLEQAIHAEAETAALEMPQGTFVSKTIKGATYWYLQSTEEGRKRQKYLGRESPALLGWMEEVRQARVRTAADETGRARLVSMLVVGGATRESAPVTKVLELLGGAGVFRMGGVLVGTQAFTVYGNMLGARFDRQSLRTQDVDVAQDRAIGIALTQETRPADMTSFKIQGRELRVDFLTPLRGPELGQPSFFLEYLLEGFVQAVVLGGAGILVNVPDPARFALHKLWLSGRRPVAEQTKAAKDLRQAGNLLEVLLEDRPEDVLQAWKGMRQRPAAAERVRKALGKLGTEMRERLEVILPIRIRLRPDANYN